MRTHTGGDSDVPIMILWKACLRVSSSRLKGRERSGLDCQQQERWLVSMLQVEHPAWRRIGMLSSNGLPIGHRRRGFQLADRQQTVRLCRSAELQRRKTDQHDACLCPLAGQPGAHECGRRNFVGEAVGGELKNCEEEWQEERRR